jgi:hypothetical protein
LRELQKQDQVLHHFSDDFSLHLNKFMLDLKIVFFSIPKRIEKYEMAAEILKSFDELVHETVNEFKKLYNIQPEIAACAPGRV